MSKIPPQYAWAAALENQPKMMAEGFKLLGIKEYPGKIKNNPVIMSMADDLGIRAIYPNDETAWCAVVHNWICLRTGKPLSGKGYDLLRAASFLNWGVPVTIPKYGDTLVFKRPNGYHVGHYVAEDKKAFHVMGGNQNNSYSIVRIEQGRLVAARQYYKTAAPSSVQQYFVADNGQISKNET